jgi:hypothetical protein
MHVGHLFQGISGSNLSGGVRAQMLALGIKEKKSAGEAVQDGLGE